MYWTFIFFVFHSFSPIFAESRIAFSTLPDLAGWRGIQSFS
jgi:hypothetical protein